MKIQLKRSNVLTGGFAKEPTAAQLEYGELAVNYNTDDPAIFLKDSNNNVIRISGIGNIADDGQVELPASNTPPLNPQPGNLWYNSEDGRLYIYYKDPDTEQWVDASPDSWDPSSYPDVSDDDAQAGTLDDRYLMLNADNSPVTGTCEFAGGVKVTGGAAAAVYSGLRAGGLRVYGTAEGVDCLNWDSKRLLFQPNNNTLSSTDELACFQVAPQQSTVDTSVYCSGFASNLQTNGTHAGDISHFRTNSLSARDGGSAIRTIGFHAGDALGGSNSSNINAGFLSELTTSQDINYNFYASGGAPNYFAGNVGIGTDEPSTPIHVKSDNGNTSWFSSTSPRSLIRFSNSDASNLYIGADGVNDFVVRSKPGTGSVSEKFRISGNGNVGIGTSSPDRKLEIAGSGGGSNVELRLNATDGGARQITFTGAGSSSIGIKANGAVDNCLVFTQGNSENLRILQNGGITFNGDTSTDNALDDYEEGSFTPSFKGSTTAGSTTTYGTQSGRYTKIGNLVHVAIYLRLASKGDMAGTIFIDGLPFPVPSGSAQRFKASLCIGAPLNWKTMPTGCITQNNTTTAKLNNYQDNGGDITDAAMLNNSGIYVSGTYTTNS